jgi:D-glycero-D-manno-heptose 1,7-bisphosphate phosphatase
MAASRRPITQAIVLAGGRGTRLGDLTREVPKPLLPVGGRPFLDYVISVLARHGVDDIILSTGYLSPAFDAFLEGRTWTGPYGNAIRVRTLVEPVPAGTAGALKQHEAELAEAFLLLNGDSFLDADLNAVLAAGALLSQGEALLTTREVQDAGRFGRIRLDNDRVALFEEKSSAGTGLINAGISVLTRACVQRIETIPCSIETDIYPVLAAEGLLKAVVQDGYFIDIGLPETYASAQSEVPVAFRKPALFLDRDGVLNVDKGYVHRAEDFEWMPGAIEAIRLARKAGMLTIVVTNQAGVAHGYYGEDAIERLHRWINAELRKNDAWIDAFYYCPYHVDAVVTRYRRDHVDRKPGPGMLNRAFADFDIDKARSFLVGDKDSDVEAAAAAGVRGFLTVGGSPLELVRSHLPGLRSGVSHG